jgi:hypothetical protein
LDYVFICAVGLGLGLDRVSRDVNISLLIVFWEGNKLLLEGDPKAAWITLRYSSMLGKQSGALNGADRNIREYFEAKLHLFAYLGGRRLELALLRTSKIPLSSSESLGIEILRGGRRATWQGCGLGPLASRMSTHSSSLTSTTRRYSSQPR